MTWNRIPLKDLGRWYGGGTPSKSNQSFWTDGTIPWLSPKDMGSEVLRSTKNRITEAAVSGSSAKLVPAGSVAVVTRSGILERTLPVALVPFETTLNQDMRAVVARDGIDPRWIAWGLRAFERDLLRDTRKAGTTVASIEMPRFHSFELPVPSLAEQRRVLDLLEDHLSRLDAAMNTLTNARRRIRSMERGALDAHFGAHPDTEFGELIDDISAGKSFGASNASAREGEWGIIKVSAMTWGSFRQEENKAVTAVDKVDPRFEIRAGDLLVSRANTSEHVGASVLVGAVRSRLLLSDKSLRIVPKPGVRSEWLWRVLQAPGARRQMSALATGTKDSMRNISQGALRSILVPAASEDEQETAVRAYRGVEEASRRLTSEIDAAERRVHLLRKSLLQAAFEGRLAAPPNFRATREPKHV